VQPFRATHVLAYHKSTPNPNGGSVHEASFPHSHCRRRRDRARKRRRRRRQASGDPGASSGAKTLTTPEEISALKRIRKNPRSYYVNMHTQEFPDGAVRGQLSNLLFNNR
jgi:hypothetical protein